MLRSLNRVAKALADHNLRRINRVNDGFLLFETNRVSSNVNFVRTKKDDSQSSLFKPVPIEPTNDDMNYGAELTGKAIDKTELLRVLNKFSQKREVRLLCMENGLDRKLLHRCQVPSLEIFIPTRFQLNPLHFRPSTITSICEFPKTLPRVDEPSSRPARHLQ